ncbi:MAG: glycoside hydrolase family 76 protein [Bacteroidota bacterium]
MVLKFASFLLISCLLVGIVKSQAPGYTTRIKTLYAGINNKLKEKGQDLYFETTDSTKNENKHAWLWPLCAFIQAANEMEKLAPGSAYMLPVVKSIDQYYSDKPPFPGYQDYVFKERSSSRFYDDNQWVAIAYLDAYNRIKNKKYLEASKMIFQFMMGGTDTIAGGGLYWKEGNRTTKNTCSNGPGVLVALQLYQITKEKKYLQYALNIYQWTTTHLQAPDGLFYDAIKIPSLKISEQKYTYNTGSMLQANVLLYTITNKQKYLQEARRMAKAGKEYFFKNGRLPNEYWFNAVMLRGYAALYKVDKNKEWIDFFKEDADRIWNTERDGDNFLGTKPTKRLIDQAAMIEIYARLQELQ